MFHALLLLLGLAAPAAALDLPAPLTDDDFLQFDRAQAELGQLLFYDKILSGNQNISCGSCHHHDLGSTDGLSLGIGEGGVGLGPARTAGTGANRIKARIPRNAPALWNLAHKDIDALFHDGRLSISDLYGNGFNSPAEEYLPAGLKSLLAAQALFPVTSDNEMAGHPGENEIAGAVHDRIDKAWPIIAERVRGIPEYVEMFAAAFDHVDRAEDITIVEIANAIAAFEGTEFRNHDSAFDAYLGGEPEALDESQMRGMELFYTVGCSGCHAGPMLTDNGFHAIGLPQFGPGRTRPWDPMPRDVGRMGETDRLEDAYKFRTPSLRNVALTAPYGHNGAMPTLEAMVRHHADPRASQQGWTPDMAALRPAPWLAATDFVIREDRIEMQRQLAVNELELPPLSDQDIADIVAFLNCLTGRTAEDRPLGVPARVPSGLPVD
ncbi:MAG: cytochrome c peroxidase [Rhodobacter sp.]|nr:cytochrome c peroxidase [Rhodobacter sp.]